MPTIADDFDSDDADDVKMGIVVNPEGRSLCPQCGRVVGKDSKFCGGCGVSLN